MLKQVSLDWGDYLQVLGKSWWLVALLVLLGAGGAFVASRFRDQIFDASTEIVIDKPEDSAIGRIGDSTIRWDETTILTQLRIIESDLLCKRTAVRMKEKFSGEKAGSGVGSRRQISGFRGFFIRPPPPSLGEFLEGQPEERLQTLVRGSASVSLLPRTRIFRVQVSSVCPEFSALAANLRAEEYAAYVSETYASSAQKAFQMLKRQSDDATLRLKDAADNLVELRKRAELQALSQELSSAGEGSGATNLPMNLRESLAKSSPDIQPLMDQLAQTQAAIARLSERYLEKHPQMVELTSKRDLLLGQIERLKDRVCAEWLSKHREERAKVEFSLSEQDLAVSRKMQEMLLEKIKEIDFIGERPSLIARVLQAAVVPSKASAPNALLNVVLGGLSGLVGGLFVAFLYANFRAAIVSSATPASMLPASIVAGIPHLVKKAAVLEIQSGLDTSSPAAEAFKAFRTVVAAGLKKTGGRIVLLTSPESGDGKSFVSLGLAQSFVSLGIRVLLVDADMRRGRLREAFSLPPGPGLAEIISGSDEVTPTQVGSNLHLIQSGRKTDRPSELLGRERLGEVLEWAAKQYDVVIVDAPPLLAVTDPSILAAHAALLYIVLREGRTHIRIAGLAGNVLTSLGHSTSGVVLNDVLPNRHRYGYGYGYGYGHDQRKS